VNIGNPTEMTVLQFAKEIIRATGSRSRIVSSRCRRTIRNSGGPTSRGAKTSGLGAESAAGGRLGEDD